ncbi:GAF domain-containing sensor histidine kinase [Colwellia sp. Bg11-28]|uniref:GAF domain-containing sensor histidine kinase n=1 Tax=Colwellia sp. Bg11-28 TaxID=2058305 RepID=UPI000C333AA3|nr:HAMP domain-containing sensor histidine kinase [Colwellia sp. Bg11-28]PKH89248.1 histidine kinase [Colwellia sp. Bg11-28]
MYNQKNEELIESWNKTLAVVAKLASVPVALVMKIEKNNITVFCKNSGTSDNPYSIGNSECLSGSGLYCEQVIKSQQILNIPNALLDENWNNNPDLKLNMIAYLGLPIVDDSGSLFGTLCILDNKEHVFSETTIGLLEAIKQSFEVQLKHLHQQHIIEEKQKLEELSILISGLSHEINTPLGIGITATSIIESNIENIQQKLASKSLSQNTLALGLSTIKESVTLLSNSLNHTAEQVSKLQDLLMSNDVKNYQLLELSSLVKNTFKKHKDILNIHNVKYKIKHQDNDNTQAFIAPDLLQQVLLILCKNSLEHGLVDIENPSISIEFENYLDLIKLHFRDNGQGIANSEYIKIFNPFYTTKRATGSSGIGLSLAKRIVTQQLHGEISIMDSSSGVHFVITLPKLADSSSSK